MAKRGSIEQMSFDFSPSALRKDMFWLSLSGVNVRITAISDNADCKSVCLKAEVPVLDEGQGTFMFHVIQLRKVLDSGIEFQASDEDKTFFDLFRYSRRSALSLQTSLRGDLIVSSSEMANQIVLPGHFLIPLISSDIEITASPDIWEWVGRQYSVPFTLGRVRLAGDGTAAVRTNRYELLADYLDANAAKTRPNNYLIPASKAYMLVSTPQINWADPDETCGPAVTLRHAARYVATDATTVNYSLDTNLCAVLASTDRLSPITTAATVAAHRSGDGVVVVTSPAKLWAWRRAFATTDLREGLLGIACTGTADPHAKVELLTPRDFDGYQHQSSPGTVIVDTDSTAAPSVGLLNDVFQWVDPNHSASRMLVTTSWPSLQLDRVQLCSVLNPALFNDRMLNHSAYLKSALAEVVIERFAETITTSADAKRTARSTLVTAPVTSDIETALAVMEMTDTDPEERLRVCTVGTASGTAPKVVALAQELMRGTLRSTSKAVVTRFSEVRDLLLPLINGSDIGDLEVLVYDSEFPDCSDFDVMFVLDMPLSVTDLDNLGAKEVVVINVPTEVEHRLFELAVTNTDSGASYPLHEDESDWLKNS